MENAKDLLLELGQLALKVTPRARIDGIEAINDMGELVIKIRAAPEDGKANAAVIALISEAWGLPKSSLSIARGKASRHKLLTYRPE